MAISTIDAIKQSIEAAKQKAAANPPPVPPPPPPAAVATIVQNAQNAVNKIAGPVAPPPPPPPAPPPPVVSTVDAVKAAIAAQTGQPLPPPPPPILSTVDILKQAAAPIIQAAQTGQAPSATDIIRQSIEVNTGKIVQIPSTNLGTKFEGTSQTFGQLYQIQEYGPDGTLQTRTISLSETNQVTSQNFDPNQLFSQLTPQQTQNEALQVQPLMLTADQVDKVIKESIKVDFFLCMKSLDSIAIEFNTMQVPDMDTELVYNFYESTEANTDIQEDPTKDPFLNPLITEIPKYINLTWTSVDTVAESTDFASQTKEEQQLIQQTLKQPRGTSTSFGSPTPRAFSNAQINTFTQNGQSVQPTDTHQLDVAFNSLSNPKVFRNSVRAIINTKSPDVNRIDFTDIILDDLTND